MTCINSLYILCWHIAEPQANVSEVIPCRDDYNTAKNRQYSQRKKDGAISVEFWAHVQNT